MHLKDIRQKYPWANIKKVYMPIGWTVCDPLTDNIFSANSKKDLEKLCRRINTELKEKNDN